MKYAPACSSKKQLLTLLAITVTACSSAVHIGEIAADGAGGASGSGTVGAGGAGTGTGGTAGTSTSTGTGGTTTGSGTGGSGSGSTGGTGSGDGGTGGTGGTGGSGSGGTTADASIEDGVSIVDSGPDGFGSDPACVALAPLIRSDSWIVFDASADKPDSGMTAPRAIVMMHPDGSGLTYLTDGTQLDTEPSLSSDAKLVSFTSNRSGTSQIFTINVATREIVQVTHRPEGAAESTFSADNQLIAYRDGPARNIYTIDSSGTERMVVGGGQYRSPSFTPDNTELVFVAYTSISAAHLDGSGQRPIVTTPPGSIGWPRVAPGVFADAAVGKQVVFTGGCSLVNIHIAPLSDELMICQTEPVAQVGTHPTWGSPEVIAYEVNYEDWSPLRAYLAAVIRGTLTPDQQECRLTPPTMDARNPTWLP